MAFTETEYKYALASLSGVGLKKYRYILDFFTTAENFWKSNHKELVEILGEKIGGKLYEKRNAFDIQENLNFLLSRGVQYSVLGSESYPYRLSNIDDPPVVIFYKGAQGIDILNNTVTIVGTRRNTDYGDRFLREIIPGLVKSGLVIASGLAFGVDLLAHKYTLESNGLTVGVIASSPDQIIPKSNEYIYNEIINGKGLVLSEIPPVEGNREVYAYQFAQRNRILAGLSATTIIIEAPDRSGALITAHLAFDYNRLVLSLPGDIGKISSKGCNKIIKIGKAQLVESLDDVLSELGIESQGKSITIDDYLSSYDFDKNEKEIAKSLFKGALSLDQLKKKIDIDTNKLLASLMKLEIKNLVRKDKLDKYYLLNK